MQLHKNSYVSEYRKMDLMAHSNFYWVINTIVFYDIWALKQAIKRVFTEEESEVISVLSTAFSSVPTSMFL